MPLLDIATAQAQPYLFSIRSSQSLYHNHHAATFIIGNESATARWRHLSISYKPQNFDRRWWRRRHCAGFVFKAVVATIAPTRLVQDNNGKLPLGVDSTSSPPTANENSEDDDDDEHVDEKELMRRKRISIANSGKRPWNCGRKHSPETLARIRERTRIAMQNPKVRKKLQTLGHAQSKETKVKIADSVRMTYQKRHVKLMVQESCRFEWENLVAEASRKGFLGEEELQWNSYKILKEQIEQEWLDSVKQRKSMIPATRGKKRAPKSPEQRKRISEAIAAKWADPGYRNRVSSGMINYYDTHGRVQTSRRKAPSVQTPKTRIPAKKTKPATNSIDMQKQRPKFKISKGPSYKDPLASSKLEMLKNIRAQRAAAESAKSEAITRAKLLIAEAQKAAQALEIAAASSPLAQASLIETRKLIAEAMQSIGSVDTEYLHSDQIGESSSFTSPETLNHVEHEPDLELETSTNTSHEKVNGFRTLDSSDSNFLDYDFSNVGQDLLDSLDNDDDDDDDLQSSSYDLAYVNGSTQLHPPGSNDFEFAKLELEHMITHASFTKQLGDFISHGTDQTETGEVISPRFGNNEPDGDGDQESMLPHHPTNFDSEKEKKQLEPRTKTKKWVRGKLVEVEGD